MGSKQCKIGTNQKTKLHEQTNKLKRCNVAANVLHIEQENQNYKCKYVQLNNQSFSHSLYHNLYQCLKNDGQSFADRRWTNVISPLPTQRFLMAVGFYTFSSPDPTCVILTARLTTNYDRFRPFLQATIICTPLSGLREIVFRGILFFVYRPVFSYLLNMHRNDFFFVE